VTVPVWGAAGAGPRSQTTPTMRDESNRGRKVMGFLQWNELKIREGWRNVGRKRAKKDSGFPGPETGPAPERQGATNDARSPFADSVTQNCKD